MSDSRTSVASMRCPVCFGREIDVLLLHNGTGYYCVKCSYRGTASEVREAYAALKRKYENRTVRVTYDELERL